MEVSAEKPQSAKGAFLEEHYNDLIRHRLEGLQSAGARHHEEHRRLRAKLFWPTIWPADANPPYAPVKVGRYKIGATLPAFATVVDEAMKRHAPCRVLDIGCGEGKLLQYLRASKALEVERYVGIDSARAEAEFPIYETIAALPAEGAFDFVVMSEVIEHMTYRVFFEEFLTKMRRLLSADGALILSTPNPLTPGVLERDVTHVQHYPWYDLYAILRFAFRHVSIARAYSVSGFGRLASLPLKMAVNSILETDWCEGLIAVASEPTSDLLHD